MPFKPKSEIAQWRILYRIFQAAEIDQPIPYSQLAEAVKVDVRKDLHRVQAAARQAGRQLLRENDRAIETVPKVGYKVVPAQRQIPMANNQVERAARSLDKGRELVTHVRVDELDAQGARIVHAMALGFAQVAEWARQIGRRVEDHEGRLSDIEAELERLREERDGKT
jgi:hypothetical protein